MILTDIFMLFYLHFFEIIDYYGRLLNSAIFRDIIFIGKKKEKLFFSF